MKNEENSMLINILAFIRTCFGFRQFNRNYERQNLYLSQPNLQMGKTLYQELYKNHQRQGKITRCQTLQSMWRLKPII
jgi:hypothetical protein